MTKFYDPELGNIDPFSEEAGKLANEVNLPDSGIGGGPKKKSPIDRDFEQYQNAMLEGDIDTLESLREKHPEDARFNIHLQVIEVQPEQKKTFKEAKAEHEATLRQMNIDGIPQLRKIMDTGNKKKALEYINSSIRKNHPLRRAMLRMVDFM